MINYVTCPYCLIQTTARKARRHQRACPQRPMTVREIVDLVLKMSETCDISFVPEDWLEGEVISRARRTGRTVYPRVVKQSIQLAIQEYYLSLGVAASDLPQFGEQP